MVPFKVTLHWIDILIFSLTLVIYLGIGIYFALSGERQRTTSEYLMGNRNMSVLPVVFSVCMTYVSAVLVLGMTAEMYQYGTQLLTQAIGASVSFVISTFVIVPVIFPLKIVSVYQYHEMRFHSHALRKLLSFCNAFQAIFVTGLGIYSPAIALEAVTGLKVWVTVICIGTVTTIYTSIGGVKAVVWTDFFQFIAFSTGIITILVMGSNKVGGIKRVWEISEEGGRLKFFNADLHYHARATVWNVCFAWIVTSLAMYGTSQGFIQRYSSLPTLKAAKTAILFNIPLITFVYGILGLTGLTIYAYYTLQGCDPLRVGQIRNSNQLLPYFVVNALGYTGFSGLMIAVLFSGALSSISTSMSAVAALVWKDFLEATVSQKKESEKALITKVIVVIVGGVGVAIALVVQYIPGHVLQISNSVVSSLSGASAGVLFLGLFIPFGNWKGAIAGMVSALGLVTWMNVGQFLTHPFKESLPTNVSSCALQGNNTIKPPLSDPAGVFPLYAVSFYWFGIIGVGISTIVSTIVSLITCWQNPYKLDKRLVVPLVYHMWSCWPLRMRGKQPSREEQPVDIQSSPSAICCYKCETKAFSGPDVPRWHHCSGQEKPEAHMEMEEQEVGAEGLTQNNCPVKQEGRKAEAMSRINVKSAEYALLFSFLQDV